ncbi:MAG TPA: tetratricopeptide repeat-containing glycosyltransferase family protein [Bacteroidota bacterium]|nr:tetratricopeptide repeat-containing glycosyltransferase family protein [Bacteroidota bacterium]
MHERDVQGAGSTETAADYGAVVDRARMQLEERVAASPLDVDAWFNLGIFSRDRGDLGRADACFHHVLALRPDHSLASVELGLICRKRGDLETAAAWYRRALEADPSSVNAHFNLGNWARDTERYAQAEAEYGCVLQAQPEHYGAWVNSGYVFEQQVRYVEALRCYTRALSLRPHHAGSYVNIGNLMKEMNDVAGARVAYNAALALDPESPEAHHSLALALLASGEYVSGWKEYEWRLRCSDTGGRIGVRVFPQPLWDGGSLEGKTIYVYGEQGMGDQIQFVRFLPELRRRGAKVVFGCYEHLLGLFARFKAANALVDVNGGRIPPFDTYLALMSLPHRLGIQASNLPFATVYLDADPARSARWRWIRETPGLSVGLVWASNTNNRHARLKSLSVEDLEPLLAAPEITFYSLQLTDAGEPAQSEKIMTLGRDIGTMEETAAIIDNLDLLISVDTSIAHLAGAMGKEVWTLLPFAADWRWPRTGEVTSWYPSMRLFRQTHLQSWTEPIREIAVALQQKEKHRA